MGRPLIEAYETGGFDGSSLVAVTSSAAVFSETIKRRWIATFPNVMFTDSIGASEVGSSGVGLLTEESINAEGPLVALSPGTIVVDDDNKIIDPDANVGRIVRTGRACQCRWVTTGTKRCRRRPSLKPTACVTRSREITRVWRRAVG